MIVDGYLKQISDYYENLLMILISGLLQPYYNKINPIILWQREILFI